MQHTNQFVDKFHKLKVAKKQKKEEKSNMATTDKESRHKVKFNTLHFFPALNHPDLNSPKP